jgi:hypothetical protein
VIERRAAERHLDGATLATLGARERALLVHVASCVACRRRLSAEERDQLVRWTDPEADAAIRRLLRELESESGLDGKMAAIQRERREVAERVRELLARPDSWGTAATEPRYASIEVAWQLLEAARDEEPLRALRLVDLAWDVAGLLAVGEHYEAAGALLELLALCLERRWPRAFKMGSVQLALDALFESPRLHPRARAVIGFLAYVLQDPGSRRAAEAVPAVRRYLAHSRYRPELPFEPTHEKPLVHLEWDDLEPRVRAAICVEVGTEEEIGRRPGKDLESDLRDFIAWRYEVLRRVRIEFTTRGREEPPAA